MNKSTVVLLLLAALGLGSVIGASFLDSDSESPRPVATTPAAAVSTGGAPAFRYLAPGDVEVVVDEFGQAKPSTVGENFIARDARWKTETVSFEIPGDGTVEYKAIMQQGDAIVFSWQTSGGDVYYDFHAHDAAFGEAFFTRYDEGEGAQRSGTIVAAYDGQHGWFWLNLDPDPIQVTLDVAGYFEKIVEIEMEAF